MLNELEDEEDFGENGQLLASNSSNNDMLTSEQNVPTVTISPSTTIEMKDESYVNGSIIYLMAKSKKCEVACTKCCNCLCFCKLFKLVQKYCPTQLSALTSFSIRFPCANEFSMKEFQRECKTIGVQVADSSMKRIIKLVNNAPMLDMYHIFFRWYGLLFFMSMCYIISTILTVCLAGILVLLYGSRDHDHALKLLMPPVLVAGIVGFALGIVITIYIRKRKSVLSNSLMGRLSQELNRRYKFLLYIDTYRNKSVALCLVKYDSEICRKYLKEFLISRATSGEISQQDDAKYDKQAGQLIFQSIPGYIQSLKSHSHLSSTPRHFISGHSMCLCQFVESQKLLDQSDDESVGYGHRKPDTDCCASCFQMSKGEYDSIPLLLDQEDED